MLVTIFTPTYNRAYSLPALYESLLLQTNKDFEWIVVDDGSTDNTELLINKFSEEGLINIHYYKQSNGGKHRAINRGVNKAIGELFFIVDSDDFLVNTSVETIKHYYNQIKDDDLFCGICGLRTYSNGKRVGGEHDFGLLDCNTIDFRYKYKVKGDMAEVVKTSVFKEFPFPEFNGEFFCPESVVWNRIAQKYKFRFIYRSLYICEYLPDGLTAKITKVRMNSPEASLICYSELSDLSIPIKYKIKSIINFWRFSFCSNKNFNEKLHMIGYSSLFLYPLGWFMHYRDLLNMKK